jgi:hypothetical protein
MYLIGTLCASASPREERLFQPVAKTIQRNNLFALNDFPAFMQMMPVIDEGKTLQSRPARRLSIQRTSS